MLCANTRRYGLCRPCPAAGSSSGVCRFQLPPYFRSFSCPTPRTAFLFSSGFFSFVPHLLRDTRPTPFYSIFPSLVTSTRVLHLFCFHFVKFLTLYIYDGPASDPTRISNGRYVVDGHFFPLSLFSSNRLGWHHGTWHFRRYQREKSLMHASLLLFPPLFFSSGGNAFNGAIPFGRGVIHRSVSRRVGNAKRNFLFFFCVALIFVSMKRRQLDRLRGLVCCWNVLYKRHLQRHVLRIGIHNKPEGGLNEDGHRPGSAITTTGSPVHPSTYNIHIVAACRSMAIWIIENVAYSR